MSHDTDKYFMPRHAGEYERLQKQHEAYQMSIGYLVHPSGQHLLGPNSRAADIGCGTAAWIRDLAQELPSSAQLDGYDLKLPELDEPLPSNVHLHVADVKQQFPESLHSAYDMVHIRLLLGAMGADDWILVARNAIQLLKPGGILQWTEVDIFSARVVNGSPKSSRAAANEIRDAFLRMCRARMELQKGPGLYELPATLEGLGLKVEEDVLCSDRDPGARKLVTWASVMGQANALRFLAGQERGKEWLDLKRVDELEPKALKEIEEGAYYQFEILVRVGIKP